jgi:RHS repeat-associated protein
MLSLANSKNGAGFMGNKLHFYARSIICFVLILLSVMPPVLAQQPKGKQENNVAAKQQDLEPLPSKKLERVDFQTCYRIWVDWYQAKIEGIEKPVPALKILNASEKELNGLNAIWSKARVQAKLDVLERKQLTPQILPQQNLTINPAKNRITSLGYSYDAAGNLIAEPGAIYDYDAENRLKTATVNGVVTDYFYDGLGQRVKKVVNGVTTRFIYDHQGRLIAEYTGDPAPSIPTKEYIYGGNGVLLAVVEPDNPDTNQAIKYLTPDHLDTPRVSTDANGNVISRHDYMPFGEEITSDIGNRASVQGYSGADSIRQKFTSHERDEETGLDFAQARYFSSMQGRFTSLDPLGKSEKLDNPQTWNRYAYVLNNPLRYRDPDGQAPQEGADIRQRQDIKALMDGKITKEQYYERQRARAIGAVIGVGLVGTGFFGVRALPSLLAFLGRNPQVVQETADVATQTATGNPLASSNLGTATTGFIAGEFGGAAYKLTEKTLEVNIGIVIGKGAIAEIQKAIVDTAANLGAEKVLINTGPIVEKTGVLLKYLERLVKQGKAVRNAGEGTPSYTITIEVTKKATK